MTLFCLLSFFILWLNMNESFPQDAIKCDVKLPALEGTRYEPAFRSLFLPGDTLRVFCGEKHWIVDLQTTTAETTCQSDGTWSIRPLCQEVICSNRREPHVDRWHVYTYHQKKLGDSVYYTCDYGYQSTSSNNHATCTRDGWVPKPLCRGTYCTKPNIENAEITHNLRDRYSQYDQVQYTCMNGNRNTFTITCVQGDWPGIKSCPAYCDKLSNEKQSMNFTSEKDKYVNGDVIEYQCIIPDPVAEGNATCMDGKWIKTVECKVKPCPHPDETPNGSYQIIEGEDYVFGTAIQYVCNQGYQMVGNDTLNCSLDGWTGTAPTCKLITCEVGVLHPGLIVTGMLSTSTTVQVGDKLQFECSGELQLHGSKETECLPTGKWSAPIPTCSEKCEVSRIPDNIVVTPRVSGRHLTKGEMLTFSCSRRGEFIQGNPTVECLASGEWSDPFPTCGAPVNCGKPPPLADGDTKETVDFQYRHNARVEYLCQNLYLMEGGPFKTCKNGEWIGQMRCLKPCTVDKDVMTTHNIRFRYSYEEKLYAPHNDVMNFSCIYGTRPVGSVGMRQMCIDGVMNFPTCE